MSALDKYTRVFFLFLILAASHGRNLGVFCWREIALPSSDGLAHLPMAPRPALADAVCPLSTVHCPRGFGSVTSSLRLVVTALLRLNDTSGV
jgi:hypothetical protein